MPSPDTACVRAPASKSISHRYCIGAVLAHGTSELHHVLDSRDLECTRAILCAAGARMEALPDEEGGWRVTGMDGVALLHIEFGDASGHLARYAYCRALDLTLDIFLGTVEAQETDDGHHGHGHCHHTHGDHDVARGLLFIGGGVCRSRLRLFGDWGFIVVCLHGKYILMR